MTKKAATLSYETRARLFYGLVAVSVVSLVVYISAVNLTVHNTAARQALETQVSVLSTRLSELEFNAIALKNNVSLDVAIAHGFEEVKTPSFITRTAGRPLSFNTSASLSNIHP